MKVLTSDQFKQLDQYTIENEPIKSIDLMERASRALALEIMARWGQDTKFYVFAGPGNNGGDGLNVARILRENGYSVKVWLFNVNNKISLDCRTSYDRLLATGAADVTEVKEGFEFPIIRPNDVVIDALFGTGLSKPLSGGWASVVGSLNSTGARIVSIDVPSGIATEDNTYTVYSNCIHAYLTLTIQMPKMAFLLPENAQCVGSWKCIDIGLSEEGIKQMRTPYTLTQEEDIAPLLHNRPPFGHKGTFGHALLVAGAYGMAGAAILAAKACMRSGVGKLTIHTASGNNEVIQTAVPEAIMSLDKNQLHLSKSIETHRFAAVGIGPGIGTEDETMQALNEYIAMADTPMVIDADAINIISTHKDWLSHLPKGSILTPHPGEMDRLVGLCSNGYERLLKAIQLASQYDIYIVLKGHNTAICSPNGKVRFNSTGNSGMATAGSGDVLTGLMTGLLAQGYPPLEATLLGVWLHGSAGDMAAEDLGEECLVASDIITYLPKAFKKLKHAANHIV